MGAPLKSSKHQPGNNGCAPPPHQASSGDSQAETGPGSGFLFLFIACACHQQIAVWLHCQEKVREGLVPSGPRKVQTRLQTALGSIALAGIMEIHRETVVYDVQAEHDGAPASGRPTSPSFLTVACLSCFLAGTMFSDIRNLVNMRSPLTMLNACKEGGEFDSNVCAPPRIESGQTQCRLGRGRASVPRTACARYAEACVRRRGVQASAVEQGAGNPLF